MTRLMIYFAAVAMVFGLSSTTLADDYNFVLDGVSAEGSGGLGSFFAPEFSAAGEKAQYKGSGNMARGADCCLSGDTYKLILKNTSTGQKAQTKWTSSGSLKTDCTATSTLPDSRDVNLSGGNTVIFKAIALPGGVPASAYVTMPGSWTQKKGTDSCEVVDVCTAPPYNPEKWNDGGFIQTHNNCYNYANDERTDTFAQPGRWCGDYPNPMACTDVYTAASCDGLIPSSASGQCPNGMHKVYLVVWPGVDYHWYRQDTSGMWSHKPGQTRARDRDDSGNPISNPETANTGSYTSRCGYMCACGDNATIR